MWLSAFGTSKDSYCWLPALRASTAMHGADAQGSRRNQVRCQEAVPSTNNNSIPKGQLVRERIRPYSCGAAQDGQRRYQRKTKEALQRREGVYTRACWGLKAFELPILKMGEFHISRADSGQNWAAGGILSP